MASWWGERMTGPVESGAVELWLQSVRFPAALYAYVYPADRVVLTTNEGERAEVSVPALAAEIDVAERRLVVAAPTGASLDVTVLDAADQEVYRRDHVVPSSGQLVIDLSMIPNLGREHHGAVTLESADANVFGVAFAAFGMVVAYDAGVIRGTATPGTTVELATSTGSGTQVVSEVPVLGDTNWQVNGEVAGIQPGDALTVTVHSDLVPQQIVLVAPELAIDYDPRDGMVFGNGPADTDLAVRVTDPSGDVHRFTVHTGAGGTFRYLLPAELLVGRGWQLAVEHGGDAPVVWRRQVSWSRTTIQLHSPRVSGTGQPGVLVRVRLFTADGTLKATGQRGVLPDGTWEALLRSVDIEQPAFIDVGDRVEVERVEGDPTVVTVPSLSAVADADQETVSGTAPTGSSVRIWVHYANGEVVDYETTTTASVSDAYTADLAGVFDLERRSTGTVAIDVGHDVTFVTEWAVASLGVSVDDGFRIGGGGAPGMPVDVWVRDSYGAPVLHRTDQVPASFSLGEPVSWGFDAQTLGESVAALQVGDEIVATIGETTLTMVVPPLVALIDTDGDRIEGITIPDVRVTTSVLGVSSGTWIDSETMSDTLGRFEVDLAGVVDLGNVSQGTVTVWLGRNSLSKQVYGALLTLDLDIGDLSGVTISDAAVTSTLLASGQLVTMQTAQSDEVGSFHITMDATELLSGREIRVTATRGDHSRTSTLVIPMLTIFPDSALNLVRGRATPGGVLGMSVAAGFPYTQPGGEPQRGGATPTISVDGDYIAQFVPRVDLAPGWWARATYWTPDMNRVMARRYVPIANVEVGGAHVCGFGAPAVSVVAVWRDAGGAVQGRAQGTVGRSGRYEMLLRDLAGSPVKAAAGGSVEVRIGDVEAVVPLPAVDIAADWASLKISGQGPPDSRWTATGPVEGCFSSDGQYANTVTGMTSADGGFSAQLSRVTVNGQSLFPKLPGEAVEMAFFTPDGQRQYRLKRRPLVRVYVHSGRVAGLVSAFEDAEVVLDTPGGDATAAVSADYLGGFDVELNHGVGTGATIRPGDIVTVRAGGDEESVSSA